MLARFDDIDRAIDLALKAVRTKSKRVYTQTYNLWKDWCHNQGVSPLDLHPGNIMSFLSSRKVTRTTRQRELSVMRTLLRFMAMQPDRPDMKLSYDLLKMAKVPDDNLSDSERNLVALSPDQIELILAIWSGDSTIHIRNRALVALMLATGLRRSEVAVLEWRDIDLEQGLLIVRHGKRDKKRDVAIVGEYAVTALQDWKAIQCRRFVFCPLDNVGGLLSDRPISGDNVYRIVKQVEKQTGVNFAPHDMRRSLATELLSEGASVADVQEQLGHVSPSTTLRYAKAANAKERRKRFKTRYGD